MIIHLREVDTPEGRFWKAETAEHEIYRRNREVAIEALIESLVPAIGVHFRDASSLTVCVVQADPDHHISCPRDEGCECGS